LSTEQRRQLITSLEKQLNSRVLIIITGDRQGMETRIAPDLLPLVSQHLADMGSVEDVSVFLYTAGGDTIVGWGLVNLFRQYCSSLKVVIPFRALSCGTLIALGADKIIMGRRGLLSPVDPSVSSPFNPPAPGVQQQGAVSLLPVSVEDMMGFLDLAKKEIKVTTEESKIAILKILADKVHPLALGAVFRAREQTSSLAKRLLMMHLKDKKKIDYIVKRLTRELPTHNYLIGRVEALNDIGLSIVEPNAEVDDLMWSLYKEYEKWLQLTTPASPDQEIGTETRKRVRYERASVESVRDGSLYQHIFVTDNDLTKVTTTPPGMQGQIEQTLVRTIYQGWVSAQNGEVNNEYK